MNPKHSIIPFLLSFSFLALIPHPTQSTIKSVLANSLSDSISKSYEPKHCSLKLLSNYLQGHTDNQDAVSESRDSYNPRDAMSSDSNLTHRESMPPSVIIQSNCTNIQDSCCLDSEFNLLKKNLLENFGKLKEWKKIFARAINKISQLDSENLKELLEYVPDEFWNQNFITAEDFGGMVQYVTLNQQVILGNAKASCDTSVDYSSGLICSICEAENHQNFQKESDKQSHTDYFKILDSEICKNMFQSANLYHIFNFVNDFSNFYYISLAFMSAYQMDHTKYVDPTHEKSKFTALTLKNDFAECKNLSEQDLNKNPKCMGLCMDLIPFNRSFMEDWTKEVIVLEHLLSDFQGEREIFKDVNLLNFQTANSSFSENALVSLQRNIYISFISLMSTHIFLLPSFNPFTSKIY